MENQNYQNDEINLIDYIKVIIKRKKMIVGIGIVFVAAATIASLQTSRMPKVYQIDSTVRIGAIGRSLFSVNEIIEKLKNRKMLQSIISKTSEDLTVEDLKKAIEVENIKDTNLFRIQMESAEPDIAISILNEIENKFILDGDESYKKNIVIVKEELRDLEERKAGIKESIKNYKQKISKHKLSSRFSSVLGSIVKYEDIYSDIDKREYILKERLSAAKNFGIVELPFKSTDSIRPGKKLNIVISAILGLTLGIFIAFFMEFWDKNVSKEVGKE